jgi:hypothetical protein
MPQCQQANVGPQKSEEQLGSQNVVCRNWLEELIWFLTVPHYILRVHFSKRHAETLITDAISFGASY